MNVNRVFGEHDLGPGAGVYANAASRDLGMADFQARHQARFAGDDVLMLDGVDDVGIRGGATFGVDLQATADYDGGVAREQGQWWEDLEMMRRI